MDDLLVNSLFQAAKEENEPFWRLPLKRSIVVKSRLLCGYCKYRHSASCGGASTATAFLSYFVKNYQQRWLHIDCSATYRKSGSDLWAVGATGIGVKTLANLLVTKAN